MYFSDSTRLHTYTSLLAIYVMAVGHFTKYKETLQNRAPRGGSYIELLKLLCRDKKPNSLT